MSSLPVYQVAHIFSTCGFVSTVILNTVFIFLTVFHTKRIDTTYKELLIVFSVLCLIFATIEFAIHPFFHSFNGGMINFNMAKWPTTVALYGMASYSGVYVSIVSFFTVMFVFRYWTMMSNPLVGFFKGWKLLILLSWSFVFGIIGGSIVLFLGPIDDYTRNYMRSVIHENYDLDVDHISGYAVVPYNPNGALRYQSLFLIIASLLSLGIQFTIVGYCGFQMHFKMNDLLKNASESHRRLQKQFFKSLVLQITSPTLTFYIPALAILLVPFLDWKFSFPSGLIVCSFSIYPPIDSLILMLIVSDYRKAIRGLSFCPRFSFDPLLFLTRFSFSIRNV